MDGCRKQGWAKIKRASSSKTVQGEIRTQTPAQGRAWPVICLGAWVEGTGGGWARAEAWLSLCILSIGACRGQAARGLWHPGCTCEWRTCLAQVHGAHPCMSGTWSTINRAACRRFAAAADNHAARTWGFSCLSRQLGDVLWLWRVGSTERVSLLLANELVALNQEQVCAMCCLYSFIIINRQEGTQRVRTTLCHNCKTVSVRLAHTSYS